MANTCGYFDVFIGCLYSHSDGTHLMKRHCWTWYVMLNSSKSVLMKNKINLTSLSVNTCIFSAKLHIWVNYSFNNTLYLLGEVAYYWKRYTVLEITEMHLHKLEALLLLVFTTQRYFWVVLFMCIHVSGQHLQELQNIRVLPESWLLHILSNHYHTVSVCRDHKHPTHCSRCTAINNSQAACFNISCIDFLAPSEN